MRAADGLAANERLIVALDVDTHDQAVALVSALPNVFFFKIGLVLFMQGDLFRFLERLQRERDNKGKIFLDLKIAGDIGSTVTRVVAAARTLGIRLFTLTEAAIPALTRRTLDAGKRARPAGERVPEFLMVPTFSSEEATDEDIVARGRAMLDYGGDGLIVSGTAIQACRTAFPDATLVSPGIRSAGDDTHDHQRSTTPAEAIRYGADYLVVGRPIIQAPSPYAAAQRMIDEIEDASSCVSKSK